MWFKKKANISGYNPYTAVDGTDWRINVGGNSWSVSQTLPSPANAGNYFYLPALGNYDAGILNNVGYSGRYWTSSADPSNIFGSYDLGFGSGGIDVSVNGLRTDGDRVDPSFE